jgi:TRAP-type C4-dicarboxylate transport system substrate-binding protein
MKKRLLGLVVGLFMFLSVHPGMGFCASAKPLKLIHADMVPEVTVAGQCTKWWGSEIEKRTGGKVKFEYNFGASLVGAYEQLNSVMNNVIQVSPYYSGYHPDQAPIPSMALLPLMNVGTLEQGLKAADEFFRNNPEVQKEFARNKVKYMNPLFTANAYMWSKGPIKSVADFKGISVRGFGPWLALFGAMGSSLVSVPVPEIYNSLERGVVKSTLLYITNGVGLNLFEVTDHLNITNLGHNCGMPMVMNLDTWNKLPEDVQRAIEEVNTKESIQNFCRINQQNYEREMKLVKEKGMKIIEFPEPEVDKMKQIARQQVWDPYAKKMDEKGLKGTETLNDLLRYVGK